MAFQCIDCGAISEDERRYQKHRRSFRSSHYYLCLTCAGRKAEKGHGRSIRIHALVALGAVMWVLHDPAPGIAWLLLNLCLLYFANVPAIALHEAGHVVGGVLARWPVYHVVVGWFGQPLFQKTLGGIKWQLNSIPVGGMAYIFPEDPRGFRLKAAIVYLSGPLANAVAAVFCFSLVPWSFLTLDQEVHLLGAFGFANLVCGMLSIVPYKVRLPGAQFETDGRAVLRALFRSEPFKQEVLVAGRLMRIQALREREQYAEAEKLVIEGLRTYPENFPLLATRALLALDLGRYHEARALYLEMLQQKLIHPYEEAMVLNNIAWADVMIGEEEFFSEACSFSEKAMMLSGASSAFQGTRGSVLVLTGRIEEGLELLKQSFAAKKNDKFGQALNACMIALGELKRGHFAERVRWRRIAAQLHPECPLLARVPETENTAAT